MTDSSSPYSLESMEQLRERVATEMNRRRSTSSNRLTAYRNDPVAFVEEAALALFTQFRAGSRSEPIPDPIRPSPDTQSAALALETPAIAGVEAGDTRLG